MKKFACAAIAAAVGMPCASIATALAQETLYVTSGHISPAIHTLDPATGDELSFNFITGAEALFSGIAIDDAGDTWAIDGFNDGEPDRLFLIDEETGAGEVIGDTGLNWNFRFVAVDPMTDVLYGGRDSEIFILDRATGDATSVAPISAPGGLDQVTCFGIDASGTGFAIDIGDTSFFRVDVETGAAEHIADIYPGERIWFNDLAFDSSGVLWATREQGGGVYTIDTESGDATLQFGGFYRGIEFVGGDAPCYADCDESGHLDFFDFLCFQNAFAAGETYADCDESGELDFFDFLCYQNAFAAGCP